MNEIRGILHDIEERGWQAALPQGGPAAFLQRTAGARPAARSRAARDAVFTPVADAPRTSLSWAALLDRFQAAAPEDAPLPRRNRAASVAPMVAGLVIAGVASLVVAQGAAFFDRAAGVSATRQSHLGGPAAAVPAALPPTPIPAAAKGNAAAAPLPAAAATPKPLAVAYEGPAQPSDAAAVSKTLPRIAPAARTRGVEARAPRRSLRRTRSMVAAARWHRRARAPANPDVERALHAPPR